MTVYGDVLFAVNALVNYLLLMGSARLGGGRVLVRRLLPAACLGGLYGVLALVPGLGFLQSLGIKAVVLSLMLLLAFGAEKRTVKIGLCFLALAFAFAGLVLLAVQAAGEGLVLFSTGAYYPVTLPGLLLLAAVGYLAAHVIFSRLAEHGGVRELTLTLAGRSVPVRALADTGNTLRDPISNEQVLVVGWQTAAQLLPEVSLVGMERTSADQVLQRLAQTYPHLRFRLIPYRAVGTGCGLLPAVRCRVTEKNGKQQDVLTAFSPVSVGDGQTFDALTGGMI